MSLPKILLFSLITFHLFAQSASEFENMDDDDLKVGQDIFTDFNEEIENNQVMEDERFFRYGRFFTFQMGLNLTEFTGNRGLAYERDGFGYAIALNYFMDFQTSFGLGVAYSKHNMNFPDPTVDFDPNQAGLVEVNMLRVFMGYRYYIETANLATAITFSNPYFTGKIEYWYVTNKYRQQSDKADEVGGGLGFSFGGGLEFPIKLKESYVNVELLYHTVSFPDKYTTAYQSVDGGYGVDDLTGNVISTTVSYVFNW